MRTAYIIIYGFSRIVLRTPNYLSSKSGTFRNVRDSKAVLKSFTCKNNVPNLCGRTLGCDWILSYLFAPWFHVNSQVAIKLTTFRSLYRRKNFCPSCLWLYYTFKTFYGYKRLFLISVAIFITLWSLKCLSKPIIEWIFPHLLLSFTINIFKNRRVSWNVWYLSNTRWHTHIYRLYIVWLDKLNALRFITLTWILRDLNSTVWEQIK